MRVGITGASGFIGRVLIRHLGEGGHELVAFSRNPDRPVAWCRETRGFAGPVVDVSGLDAVVNLAGESILGPWTAAKRERILASRVQGTDRLVQALRRAADEGNGPKVLINASATGIYGDRGDAVLDEDAPAGAGFLAEVARRWEEAAAPAQEVGVRVAHARIGFTLGRDGGTWPLLRRAFGLGLGGRLGDGQQWMSLIHVEDAAALLGFLLENEAASGPFNTVCPEPVRNAEFTRTLGAALHRPAILPAPAFVLRTVMGDLSHLLLDSQRAVPTRTLAAGYAFRFPTVAAVLADLVR